MGRRILVAVLITLVILSVTRRMSMNRPREIYVKTGTFEIYHRTVTEQIGPGRPVVRIRVTPPTGVRCSIELEEKDRERVVLDMYSAGDGVWEVLLPEREKGAKVGYAVLVGTDEGVLKRLPVKPDRFFVVKYKGRVSGFVLVSHVAFMFGSFFFMVLSMFGAVRILKGIEDKRITANLVRWVLFLTFVGGWPLGWILNYQAFGVIWEGIPFGYDVTDNKTQIMFIFWIVTSLLAAGSVFRGDESSDRLSARGFAIAVIVSVLVSIGVFLIPHSM